MDCLEVSVNELCCLCLQPGSMDVNEIRTYSASSNGDPPSEEIFKNKYLTFNDLIGVFNNTKVSNKNVIFFFRKYFVFHLLFNVQLFIGFSRSLQTGH